MPVVINMQPAVQRPYSDLIRLEDLVASGSVPNGFYVASGTRELVRDVLGRVVDLFKSEFESPAADMSGRSHIGRLFWIDSGNSFDAYHVARKSAEQGLDPKRVLRAIQVARPFTAFQFQQMLNKVPLTPTLSHGEREAAGRERGITALTPVVIISDLMGLFYDEEIQEKDVNRAFQNFVKSLSMLGDRALVLALCLDHSIPYQRRALVSQALQLAKRVSPSPKIPVFAGNNELVRRSYAA